MRTTTRAGRRSARGASSRTANRSRPRANARRRVPASRTAAVARPRVRTVQRICRRPTTRQVTRTSAVRPRGPRGPAGPGGPGGPAGPAAAAETVTGADVESATPAAFVAVTTQATAWPMSASDATYVAPVAPATGVPSRSQA